MALISLGNFSFVREFLLELSPESDGHKVGVYLTIYIQYIINTEFVFSFMTPLVQFSI